MLGGVPLVKFDKSLTSCCKPAIRLLANIKRNDCRTVLGNNLVKIAKKCQVENLNELSSMVVKSKMEFFPTPESETWRIELINELLSIKAENQYNDGFYDENFTKDEFNSMLQLLCAS